MEVQVRVVALLQFMRAVQKRAPEGRHQLPSGGHLGGRVRGVRFGEVSQLDGMLFEFSDERRHGRQPPVNVGTNELVPDDECAGTSHLDAPASVPGSCEFSTKLIQMRGCRAPADRIR
ncbi:hypothetical protein Vau01_096600 [Virgisporangium aurantiacum]|uniref:Uncharacterized protein n=1 Tax=Virgisporangium aurantiacum TaxID=175570 RepID=A0A8J3ZDV2_9ACTN|nr:hypothetical protein Vau01_096600 [Virgisporangium aurantiacum]